MTINDPGLWRAALPVPGEDSHKYDRGHALVVSGSPSSTGAARLAAGAALRVGAGAVTLAAPGNAMQVNAAHLTAVMLTRADDAVTLAETVRDKRIGSVVIGPGFGVGDRLRGFVDALAETGVPLVLDADALTSFQPDPEALFALTKANGHCVLTPHDGEFARLADTPPDDDDGRVEAATALAERSGAIVVLKGPRTIIAAPGVEPVINHQATPWLATAGSGDVLAGTIGGLLAAGLEPPLAACAGVWLHGDAGRRCGPYLTAEDLEDGLRRALVALMDQSMSRQT